jgi:hypothetical protein
MEKQKSVAFKDALRAALKPLMFLLGPSETREIRLAYVQ